MVQINDYDCMPCCCGSIDQASVGLIERGGRFVGFAEPGFHCLNFLFGECLVARISTRVFSFNFDVDAKTKDDVFVNIHCSIHHRIIRQRADDAYYELQKPIQQIQTFATDVVRSLATKMSFTELIEQKGTVAKSVHEELQKVMEPYGYSIEHALIMDIKRRNVYELESGWWNKALHRISTELEAIKQMFRSNEDSLNNDAKRSLFLRIHHNIYNISYNELYAVFSPFGSLQKVSILSSFDRFHSRISFEREEDAIRALNSLQGRNLYGGCCQMELVLASNIDVENSSILDQSNRTDGPSVQENVIGQHEEQPLLGDQASAVRHISHNVIGQDAQQPLLGGQASTVRHISHNAIGQDAQQPLLGGQAITVRHISHNAIGQNAQPPLLGAQASNVRHISHNAIGQNAQPPLLGAQASNVQDIMADAQQLLLSAQASSARRIVHENTMGNTDETSLL